MEFQANSLTYRSAFSYGVDTTLVLKILADERSEKKEFSLEENYQRLAYINCQWANRNWIKQYMKLVNDFEIRRNSNLTMDTFSVTVFCVHGSFTNLLQNSKVNVKQSSSNSQRVNNTKTDVYFPSIIPSKQIFLNINENYKGDIILQ